MKPMIPLTLTALLLTGGSLMACNKSACDTEQPKTHKQCGGMNAEGGKGHMHGGQRHEHPIAKALEQLDLSDEQMDKLEALQKTFQEQRTAQRSSRRKGMSNMIDAIGEKGFDAKAFEAAELEQSKTRAAMKASHIGQVVEILTPEQRVELKKVLKSMPQQKRHLKLDV